MATVFLKVQHPHSIFNFRDYNSKCYKKKKEAEIKYRNERTIHADNKSNSIMLLEPKIPPLTPTPGCFLHSQALTSLYLAKLYNLKVRTVEPV